MSTVSVIVVKLKSGKVLCN